LLIRIHESFSKKLTPVGVVEVTLLNSFAHKKVLLEKKHIFKKEGYLKNKNGLQFGM
jgi:hypothetical protein